MTIEENGFHFRRVGADRFGSRWGSPSCAGTGPREVRDDLVEDWRERLAARYPRAAGAPLRRAWAGFYDMTPDAHPIIGRGRGRSSTRPVASPATASCSRRRWVTPSRRSCSARAAVRSFGPYRLERFAGGAIFPETLVL